MVAVVILLFLMLLLIINKNTQADHLSKRLIHVFIIEWLLVLLLSCYSKSFGFDEVDFYSFTLLFMNVLFFTLSFLFRRRKLKVRYLDKKVMNVLIERWCTHFLFRSILIVSTLYVVSLFFVFWQQVLINEAIGDMRVDFFDGSLYGHGFVIANLIILTPLSVICAPLFGFKLLFHRDWMCLLIGVFLFCFHSLGGGRFGYIQIVLSILMSVLLFGVEKRKLYRFLMISFIGSCIFYGIMLITTSARLGYMDLGDEEGFTKAIEETNKQLVSYPLCPTIAFAYAVNKGDYINRLGGYQFGQLSFSPIFDFVYVMSSKVGIPITAALYNFVKIKQDEPIIINEIGDWNALYTAPVFFYLDFGLIGIILLATFWGFIYALIIGRVANNYSVPGVVLIYMLFYGVTYSIFDYNFTNMYTLLLAIILLHFSSKKRLVNS